MAVKLPKALIIKGEKPFPKMMKPPTEEEGESDEDVNDGEDDDTDEGPNDDIHEPVDATPGYAPHVVKVPMHQNADVNPEIAQKQEHALRKEESGGGEEKVQKPNVKKALIAKGAGWSDKDERQYNHIKESGESEKIAAATVNKQRRKEGRLLHPNVKKAIISKGVSPDEDPSMDDVGNGTVGTQPKAPASTRDYSYQAAPQWQAFNQGVAQGILNPSKPTPPPPTMMQNVANRVEATASAESAFQQQDRMEAAMKNANTTMDEIAAKHAQEKAAKPTQPVAVPQPQSTQPAPTKPTNPTPAQTPKVAQATPPKTASTMGPKSTMAKSEPNVILKSGAGSRGGKIAYYTKSGAAVYQSKVKKMAPGFSQMANNWTKNAENSRTAVGNGATVHESASAHSTAAKQHLAAAFYQHHAGNSEGASKHLDYAKHHATQSKKNLDQHLLHTRNTRGEAAASAEHGQYKRDHKWIDKNYESTHALVHGKASDDVKKSLVESFEAFTPSNHTGGIMSNEVENIFKSELGASNASAETNITKCIHCDHGLTKSDLRKGLGPQFVADDNDNPHDGGSGQVEPSRPGSGVSENDVIAPLLKGLKGSEAGDGEEFVISKSEMSEMGMNVDKLDDGYYTITKSEMKRLGAEEHIAFLADRKNKIAKSTQPQVIKKGGTDARATQEGPHGFTPRAAGVTGNGGAPLVQWSEGSDKEVASYIAKSGGYGPGTDESIRTQGRGHGEG